MAKGANGKDKKETLVDRWLGALKNNPLVAALIVVCTIFGAIVTFWDQASKFYHGLVDKPVALATFHLAKASDGYMREESFTCLFDDKNLRTFTSRASSKANRSISLDFVFTNQSKTDAIFSQVDLIVSAAETTAGGSPGIVTSNHTYVLNIKHKVGTQVFPLTPSYKVPGNDTGSFTLEFVPETEGVGMCWIMRAVFKTNLGNVTSPDFSLIMSNFRK